LSKQTLSKIEEGEGNPTVDTLAQLGAALDMPARRLLTEWGTPVFVQRNDDAEWSVGTPRVGTDTRRDIRFGLRKDAGIADGAKR
jgi:transcriptional regulator with XRE-family HTH domain